MKTEPSKRQKINQIKIIFTNYYRFKLILDGQKKKHYYHIFIHIERTTSTTTTTTTTAKELSSVRQRCEMFHLKQASNDTRYLDSLKFLARRNQEFSAQLFSPVSRHVKKNEARFVRVLRNKKRNWFFCKERILTQYHLYYILFQVFLLLWVHFSITSDDIFDFNSFFWRNRKTWSKPQFLKKNYVLLFFSTHPRIHSQNGLPIEKKTDFTPPFSSFWRHLQIVLPK